MYTGNTRYSVVNYTIRPVYPCVYREHDNLEIDRSFSLGLSLCIQGTRAPLFFLHIRERFIPVHTGNSSALVVIAHLPTVYPCAYRELRNVFIETVLMNGLSLCIQGTH